MFHFGVTVSLDRPFGSKHYANGKLAISLSGSLNAIDNVQLVTSELISSNLVTSNFLTLGIQATQLMPTNIIPSQFVPSALIPSFLLPSWEFLPSLYYIQLPFGVILNYNNNNVSLF